MTSLLENGSGSEESNKTVDPRSRWKKILDNFVISSVVAGPSLVGGVLGFTGGGIHYDDDWESTHAAMLDAERTALRQCRVVVDETYVDPYEEIRTGEMTLDLAAACLKSQPLSQPDPDVEIAPQSLVKSLEKSAAEEATVNHPR